MKYDDASWHYGGEFPKGLPKEAGATHTGMFLAWALLADLGGQIHTEDCPEDLHDLAARTITPGQFFFERCDGKFWDEDLNDEGNAFARFYYQLDSKSPERFLTDYASVFSIEDLASVYHVPDTWSNFDLIKPIFDRRLAEWRMAQSHGN